MEQRLSAGVVKFADGLSASTSSLLQAECRRTVIPRDVVLYEAQEVIDNVYFPVTGVISLTTVSGSDEVSDGTVTAMIGATGAYGVHSAFGARRAQARVQVTIEGAFDSIPSATFESIAMADSLLKDHAARYIETLWFEAQKNATCGVLHDARRRFCRWLLECADHGRRLQLPVTHDLVARAIGVQRTTVTLLAGELQNEGIIGCGRRQIEILSRARLETQACGCYQGGARNSETRSAASAAG